jgi:1,4-alpha-glucan branching enzyme
MSMSLSHSSGFPRRYSAKNNVKPVNFIFLASEAKRVALIGDFNQWDPAAHPLKRQPDGAWAAQVALSHGPHQYLFWVDGQTKLDPRAQGVVRNAANERVSLITIS